MQVLRGNVWVRRGDRPLLLLWHTTLTRCLFSCLRTQFIQRILLDCWGYKVLRRRVCRLPLSCHYSPENRFRKCLQRLVSVFSRHLVLTEHQVSIHWFSGESAQTVDRGWWLHYQCCCYLNFLWGWWCFLLQFYAVRKGSSCLVWVRYFCRRVGYHFRCSVLVYRWTGFWWFAFWFSWWSSTAEIINQISCPGRSSPRNAIWSFRQFFLYLSSDRLIPSSCYYIINSCD